MRPLILRRIDDPGPDPRADGRVLHRRTAHRDPAPSRVAYRLHRLWLTPSYRRLLRVGLPLAIVVGALGAYFGNAERRAEIVAKYHQIQREIETRPEFMVSMVAIDGATPPLAQAIRQTLALKLPQSSFDLNVSALRAKVDALDAVAAADVEVAAGGVLKITIIQRVGVIVWRTANGIEMLDATGHRVAGLVDRDARADLPLIAGAGADKAVPQALELLKIAGPLSARIRGLVRVGERRWDVVLDRDQKIELPEVDPAEALERVIALDHAQKLLERDITVVDMRNEARPTIRLAPAAMEELQKMRQSQAGAKTL